MKVLSVRNPWAWAIIHGKDCENRSWKTPHRGPLLIHASMADWTEDEHEFVRSLLPGLPDDLDGGQIIGMVDVVGMVTASGSPWFSGPVGWQLANPRACEPFACKGKLGLWNAPAEFEWKELVRA